jgi:PhnB protein
MKRSETQKIKTVPEPYTSVTPWIISSSSVKLIEFLTDAFGAEEMPGSRITDENDVIIHVVVKLGSAMLLLFDAREGWGPTPAFLNLYVEDIEEACQKTLKLGAKLVTDITALYFGEKVCRVLDPFGNLWWLNQRMEEIDAAEIGQRAATREAKEGIAYIQKSLNEALLSQKEFFGK